MMGQVSLGNVYKTQDRVGRVIVAHKGVNDIAEFILDHVLSGVLFGHRQRYAQWAVASILGGKFEELQTWLQTWN